MAEQIEAKLYTYDQLSMRNKRFTQMMSSVPWFGSHIGFTIKHIKSFFSRTAGHIKGKLHKNSLKACVHKAVKEKLMSHGLGKSGESVQG